MQFVASLKVLRNLYSTKNMESPGGDWEPNRLENPLKSTPKVYGKFIHVADGLTKIFGGCMVWF